MALFDNNTWYTIENHGSSSFALLSASSAASSDVGTNWVACGSFISQSPAQQWQLIQSFTNFSYYLVRPRILGTSGMLGCSDGCGTTECISLPQVQVYFDSSALWIFDEVPGTSLYTVHSQRNGPDWFLNLATEEGHINFVNAANAGSEDHNTSTWSVTPAGSIDDVHFSSVPSGGLSAMATTQPVTSPTADVSSPGANQITAPRELSKGSLAAIGTVAAFASLVTLVVLGLWARQCRSKRKHNLARLDGAGVPSSEASFDTETAETVSVYPSVK